MNLEGKVAVVTGAAVRIGRSLALSLAEAGCDLCVHYHTSKEAAEQTCADIEQLGRRAVAVAADLSAPEQAAAEIIGTAVDQLGKVDILVNSASIFENHDLLQTTGANWDAHLQINLKAPCFLSQRFANALTAKQRGHIINIADWRAERAGVGHLAYRISKAGLVTLTECLALELAPTVQVNAIAPGAILPPPGEATSYLEARAAKVPLKRAGNPQEICDALLYLLRSDFVTGEVLTVAGGEQLTAGLG